MDEIVDGTSAEILSEISDEVFGWNIGWYFWENVQSILAMSCRSLEGEVLMDVSVESIFEGILLEFIDEVFK